MMIFKMPSVAGAAITAEEPQHAPAAALVECHGAIALGAPVAGPPRTNHADHASDLPVRRLDVEDPVIRAVVLNRQEDRCASRGPRHPAAPRPREARKALDRLRGQPAPAASDARRDDEDGPGRPRAHPEGVRRPDAGWSV